MTHDQHTRNWTCVHVMCAMNYNEMMNRKYSLIHKDISKKITVKEMNETDIFVAVLQVSSATVSYDIFFSQECCCI